MKKNILLLLLICLILTGCNSNNTTLAEEKDSVKTESRKENTKDENKEEHNNDKEITIEEYKGNDKESTKEENKVNDKDNVTEENKNQVVSNNEQNEYLIKLKFNELQTKIDNKESFILVITQTTCSHCHEYRPILINVLEEYNIVAYELELDKLTTKERGKLNDIANVSGTPTTIFIYDGVEKSTTNRIIGSVAKNKLVSKFKAMGYIKE